MKNTLLFLLLFTFQNSFSQSIRKTDWTVAETIEYITKNKTYSTWEGMLLYQGSDSIVHHFIYRIMDEWAFITIKKEELTLEEINLYSKTSSSPLGYYYVDPFKKFVKIKEL